jgi:hypothetical protein
MAQGQNAARFRFLYRQGEGVLAPREWAAAAWPPVAIVAAMTLIWVAIAPNGPRDLSQESLFSLGVVAAHAYFMVYAFAILICAVAEYFVSAKRFADRGKPPALAGLAPFSLLVAGAAHWYQPRSEGAMPAALSYVFDVIALAIVGWNIVELGFGPSRTPWRDAGDKS